MTKAQQSIWDDDIDFAGDAGNVVGWYEIHNVFHRKSCCCCFGGTSSIAWAVGVL